MIKRYGLVFDQGRCVGCEACSIACQSGNKAKAGFWIWVEKPDKGGKDVSWKRFSDPKMIFLPQTCMHCSKPPCVERCPAGAITKRDDGPVVLDKTMCDGCRVCVEVCPYGAINFDEETKKAEKCDLCVHRIDQGLEPFCVLCCMGPAIFYGDLNDPLSDVSQLVSSGKTFQLKPEKGTGPSVCYLPYETEHDRRDLSTDSETFDPKGRLP